MEEMTIPFPISKHLKKIASILQKENHQCWLVGGAIRDTLLGSIAEDFDLATDATPDKVIRLFRYTIPTGIKHGTVSILMGSHRFETTTFRHDGRYSDGRHPDEVTYSNDIRCDLARRDFTINAIAWDLINKKLFDPHDGQRDLEQGIIRAIGNPILRFKEDALRIIRACRFASQLNFRIEEQTLTAIAPLITEISKLSVERIWEELKKILSTSKPSIALKLFQETGLWDALLFKSGKDEKIDVNLMICNALPKNKLCVRIAALFQHLEDSTIAEKFLTHFKASNTEKKEIVPIVQLHKNFYRNKWLDSEIRHFISRTSTEILNNLILFETAKTSIQNPGNPEKIEALMKLGNRIQFILERKDVLSVKELNINGKIIMDELSIEPTPQMGKLFQYLLGCVLDCPESNTKDKLIELSREWLARQN